MKKYIWMVVLGAGICSQSLAQQNKKKYRFSSINNFLVFAGNSTIAGGFQSVNGLKKENWFAGLGLGLDYYLYRTMPVFIDVRRVFGTKPNKMFVYADAGINIPLLQEEYKMQPDGWDPNRDNKYYTGFFSDLGIGFSIDMKKGKALLFSLGHSVKTFKEDRWYSDWNSEDILKDTYHLSLSRMVCKVGWKF